MTRKEYIDQLKAESPHIAISVDAEYDGLYEWDGCGEDHKEDRLYPFVVTVTAYAIQDGEIIQGRECLGGCYAESAVDFEQDESSDQYEIHGYFHQMAEQAVLDLHLATEAKLETI